MTQNIFERVCSALSDGKVNLMELSRRSKVAYGTLHALSQGKGNPTIATLLAVQDALLAPHDDKNLTCENCFFCLEFNEADSVYGCEVFMMAKDDPRACWLFREIKKDAT
jgi:hypothetical protein